MRRTMMFYLIFPLAVFCVLCYSTLLAQQKSGSSVHNYTDLKGRICFIKKGNLFILELDDGKINKLTDDGINADPSWALNGKSIFLARATKDNDKKNDYNINIFEYNLESRKILQLTHLKGKCRNPYMVKSDRLFFWHAFWHSSDVKGSLKLGTKAILFDHRAKKDNDKKSHSAGGLSKGQ